MSFGIVPVAAQFVVSVVSWMVKSRVNAATAAQYAAAEFDYLKKASDGQLTEIAFAMARQFPQYHYWEWFRIMQDLRSYGGLQPPNVPAGPPALPPGEKDPDVKKDDTNVWMWAAAAVAVAIMISR